MHLSPTWRRANSVHYQTPWLLLEIFSIDWLWLTFQLVLLLFPRGLWPHLKSAAYFDLSLLAQSTPRTVFSFLKSNTKINAVVILCISTKVSSFQKRNISPQLSNSPSGAATELDYWMVEFSGCSLLANGLGSGSGNPTFAILNPGIS